MELDETKAGLRAVLRDRRRAMSAETLAAAAEGLTRAVLARPEVEGAQLIALYVSYGPEPDTTALRKELRARGVRVILPVVLPDYDLDWAEDAGDAELYYPLRGPATPRGPRLGCAAVASADVVIVPGLAVDRDGVRLGQGAGCYDRSLARVPPGVPVLVLVHDGEVLAPGAVPCDLHDRRVTGWVVPADAPAAHSTR